MTSSRQIEEMVNYISGYNCNARVLHKWTDAEIANEWLNDWWMSVRTG